MRIGAGMNMAALLVLVLVITNPGKLDAKVLMERSHPGLFYNILQAANCYVEEENSNSYIVTRVNKEGFGAVTPQDLTYYLRCNECIHSGLVKISLLFQDDTGIELANNQARYGVMDENGNIGEFIAIIDLKIPVIYQIQDITDLNLEYDNNGNIVYQFRTDATGKGVADQYGVVGIKREYKTFEVSLFGRNDKLISEQYLGADGKPVNRTDNGCSLLVYEYGDDGISCLTRCYDKSGKQLLMGSAYFHKFLQSLKGKDFIISVNDEGTNSLSEPLLNDLRNLGIMTELENKYRYSFYAISMNGRVIEDLSQEKLHYYGNFNGRTFDIISSGYDTGGFSSIIIDQVQYSQNVRGMNFSVINETSIESIAFDTHTPYMNVTR